MEKLEGFLLNFSCHNYVAPLLVDSVKFENGYFIWNSWSVL